MRRTVNEHFIGPLRLEGTGKSWAMRSERTVPVLDKYYAGTVEDISRAERQHGLGPVHAWWVYNSPE
ncbi:hypothetical protein EHS25_008316 [Saitozyma podzolica]|uniref:Uncharacterized protein n=1 Tax=Saitozyma podzolica TaxID=1890683 RepID=A0A427YP85_9TREE|nr:hypothetical protein EHS25_008316 [Saitozyma podzolica]